MKWFQQHRALVTFLVIPGVCILLGAGLLYWRLSAWHDAKQTFDLRHNGHQLTYALAVKASDIRGRS